MKFPRENVALAIYESFGMRKLKSVLSEMTENTSQKNHRYQNLRSVFLDKHSSERIEYCIE